MFSRTLFAVAAVSCLSLNGLYGGEDCNDGECEVVKPSYENPCYDEQGDDTLHPRICWDLGRPYGVTLVQNYIDALNNHDYHALTGMFHSDCKVDYVSLGTSFQFPQEQIQYQQFMMGTMAAIPDLHYELTNVFGAGKKVAYEATVTGTYSFTMQGFPAATGQKFSFRMMATGEVKDKKLVNLTVYYDTMSFFGQLNGAAATCSCPCSCPCMTQ